MRVKLNKSKAAQAQAREFRRNMSVSEKWFWTAVRKDLLGFRIRRQVAIGPYFLDFYIPSVKLCVEIDGEQHSERVELDMRRDEYLASYGILTIRIPSLELFHHDFRHYDAWIQEVECLCWERSAAPGSPPPTPSSRKRKEGDSDSPI